MDPVRKPPPISHAKTLSDVAAWSDSRAVFRRNLRDWAEQVRGLTVRSQLIASVIVPPRVLRGRFPEGAVADAWLAAYAEYVCLHMSAAIPEWALKPNRFLVEPSFDDGVLDPKFRALVLDASPEAFRRRNVFTTAVDLVLKAGAEPEPGMLF
ncbi:MAG: hypothetical protein QM691_03460 [Opitutaceae bacterium]